MSYLTLQKYSDFFSSFSFKVCMEFVRTIWSYISLWIEMPLCVIELFDETIYIVGKERNVYPYIFPSIVSSALPVAKSWWSALRDYFTSFRPCFTFSGNDQRTILYKIWRKLIHTTASTLLHLSPTEATWAAGSGESRLSESNCMIKWKALLDSSETWNIVVYYTFYSSSFSHLWQFSSTFN